MDRRGGQAQEMRVVAAALRVTFLLVCLVRGSSFRFSLLSHRELSSASLPEEENIRPRRQPLNVEPPDSIGEKLWKCAEGGDVSTMKSILLEWGAHKQVVDFHNPEQKSSTPLSIAAKSGHSRCIELLLAADADSNSCDAMGESPAMLAAKMGHSDSLDVLAQAKGIQLNTRSRIGATAVYWAAFRGHVRCLQVLIKAGADVSIPNSFGVKPLDLAKREGWDGCVVLLESAAM